MLLIMSRHYSSFIVHCVLNILEERSSCSMKTLGLTLLIWPSKIENMWWEFLPHPPYSPHLAPSDYHLFGFIKNQVRGQHYEINEALKTAVCQCLERHLERSSTARKYSNFQNGGKNVYREKGVHSFSILSDDRSKAYSKTMPPHSAIQSLLLQMRISSSVLKVIQ